MYRRELLSQLGRFAKLAVLVYGVEVLNSHPKPNLVSISLEPHQVGYSLDSNKASWYGLPPEETHGHLLKLPMGRARIAARMSDVAIGENEFDFRVVIQQIEQALKEGKLVDLQLGIKTFGREEVNLPAKLLDQYPLLKQSGAVLDQVPQLRTITRNYLIAGSRELIRRFPEIATLGIENEALSQRLEVSRGRHISREFLLEEAQIIKDGDPFNRPLVQNPNWDTPEAALWLFSRPEFEIMAINVFNNTEPLFRPLLWKWVNLVYSVCQISGKRFAVSEYQAAYWLKSDKSPKYPYSETEFESGYYRLASLNPAFLLFWDPYQVLEKAQKGEKPFDRVYSFISNPNSLGLRSS